MILILTDSRQPTLPKYENICYHVFNGKISAKMQEIKKKQKILFLDTKGICKYYHRFGQHRLAKKNITRAFIPPPTHFLNHCTTMSLLPVCNLRTTPQTMSVLAYIFWLITAAYSFHGVKQMAPYPVLQAGYWMLLQIRGSTTS